MGKISILLITLLFSLQASACIIDPFVTVSMNTAKLRTSADIVFFGKLKAVLQNETGEQTALFTMIKPYKGDVKGDIVIKNEAVSSWFRPFQTLHSAYYIFATKTQYANQYEVTSSLSNGFISLEAAMALSWNIE